MDGPDRAGRIMRKHGFQQHTGRLVIDMKWVTCTAGLAVSLMLSVPSSWAATIFVADEGESSITAIDSVTGKSERLEVEVAPHNVDLTPDGKTVLVVGTAANHHGHGGGAGATGKLLLLETNGLEMKPRAAIEVGGHPAHVVPDLTGRLAFVTDAETNSVVVVDLAGGQVKARVKVGQYPHGLRLSPDGRTLAVANRDGGTVSFVDTSDLSRVSSIEVGKAPVQVAFDPSGRTVFVTLSGEDRIAAIDLGSRRVTGRYPVGHGPIQIAVSPDGTKVVVANQGTRSNPARSVSILDARTGKALASVTVGSGAHGVAISRDSRIAFVTNTFDDSLSIVDIIAGKEIAKHATGAGPNGVAVR